MRTARFALLLMAASFCCQSVLAEDLPAQTAARQFTLPEYIRQLDLLRNWANQALTNSGSAREALDDLHGDWTVDAEGRSFSIDTGWLTDQFEKLQKKPSQALRDDIVGRLNAMKGNAQAFAQPPPDSAVARNSLEKILARGEFHQVHGTSWWDRVKFRIEMWIYRMLSRFFGSSSAPTVGKVFVWGLTGLAVLALAYFIFRTMRQSARIESIIPEGLTVSAKQWRVWLREAQAASEKGLWRDAVHLAYWAGISYLEESGMWRPDQARTPREYLRLLPAGSQHRTTLSTLTRRLEVTWYGNETAGPETFSETLSNLEELGCRD